MANQRVPNLEKQMIEIPKSRAEVSLDWLNSSLAVVRGSDREIVAFEMSESLQGQSSVTRNIHVVWGDGERTSFFLKMLNPVAPFVELH